MNPSCFRNSKIVLHLDPDSFKISMFFLLNQGCYGEGVCSLCIFKLISGIISLTPMHTYPHQRRDIVRKLESRTIRTRIRRLCPSRAVCLLSPRVRWAIFDASDAAAAASHSPVHPSIRPSVRVRLKGITSLVAAWHGSGGLNSPLKLTRATSTKESALF